MFQRQKQHSSNISQDLAQTQSSQTISTAPTNAPIIGQELTHAHIPSPTSILAPSHVPPHGLTVAIPTYAPKPTKSSSRQAKLQTLVVAKSSSRGQSS